MPYKNGVKFKIEENRILILSKFMFYFLTCSENHPFKLTGTITTLAFFLESRLFCFGTKSYFIEIAIEKSEKLNRILPQSFSYEMLKKAFNSPVELVKLLLLAQKEKHANLCSFPTNKYITKSF